MELSAVLRSFSYLFSVLLDSHDGKQILLGRF
jgi:hypothetical protein